MDLHTINTLLSQGKITEIGLFPRLDALTKSPFIFSFDFGLKELPMEPGILMIRGARQYGKSTWLEQEIRKTIQQFGPGTAYYLNGEDLADANALEKALEELIILFPSVAPVKRIFIDEITALDRWEYTLKKLADKGLLKSILVITTGSKATDLRRGAEKLPGRKGRLSRTTYLFTPISYHEFHKVCGMILGSATLPVYLLSGGSPVACSILAVEKIIPEFVIELTRDWIEGEVAATGRSRTALFNVLNSLYRYAMNPLGQAKLARESGLSNNTVAASYIEILQDLGCITPAYPYDIDKNILILRKPCKYHFTNLLSALSTPAIAFRRCNSCATNHSYQGACSIGSNLLNS